MLNNSNIGRREKCKIFQALTKILIQFAAAAASAATGAVLWLRLCVRVLIGSFISIPLFR